ncbi:MAG: thioesterase family protein [Spirochaetales bacterium]|nr:thioesterase family protein [Spirochaetales bacterium]
MNTFKFRHIVPIQIRFNDVDGQQHVNNAIYQQYFDIGRAGYLGAIKGGNYETGGKSFIIASVKTDFLLPIFMYDKIQVETRTAKIGTKSLTIESRIVETGTENVKAVCETVFVAFDYDKQEVLCVTDETRKQIKAYDEG